MGLADCTPDREPRSVAASYHLIICYAQCCYISRESYTTRNVLVTHEKISKITEFEFRNSGPSFFASVPPGYIVLDGDPAPPPPKGHSPQFSAHVYCGQTAGFTRWHLAWRWCPGHIVLDGDPASLPKRGQIPQFSPIFIVAKRLDAPRCQWYGGRPRRGHIVLDRDPAPPRKGHSIPHFWAHVYCGQTAGWIRKPLGTEVDLDPGDTVLDGAQFPPLKGTQQPHSPHFSVHFAVSRSPIIATAELLYPLSHPHPRIPHARILPNAYATAAVKSLPPTATKHVTLSRINEY